MTAITPQTELVKQIKLPELSKEHKAKKIKDAIVLINDIVKIKIAPSKIHGVGIFALYDIKKGEKLYTDIIPHQFDIPYSKFYKIKKVVRDLILGQFPLITQGSHFIYPVAKMSGYLNHSNNANYNAKDDIVLRDIKKGEEVTENYREIKGWQKVFPFLLDKKKI